MHVGATIKRSSESLYKLDKAKLIELNGGVAFYLKKKFAIHSEIKYLSIEFEGRKGSLVEYTMLDSYKDGNNFNWELGFDFKMNSFLQFQLNYSGRKTAENGSLHTGRMQLRANF